MHIVKTPPNNPQRFKANERVRHVLNPSRRGTIRCLLYNQQRAEVVWDDSHSAYQVDVVNLERE